MDMYKVKVVFEFGEGYISKVLVEEFDTEHEMNFFLNHANQVKQIGYKNVSYAKLLEITEDIGLAQYWLENWLYVPEYGYGHIAYVEKSVK
jgi:hypothetical protein